LFAKGFSYDNENSVELSNVCLCLQHINFLLITSINYIFV